MFWAIFRIICHDNKIFNRKRSIESTLNEIECQTGNNEKEIIENVNENSKKSSVYLFICIWGYFEILILVIVLILKGENEFPENIFHGYCSHDRCAGMIEAAIAYKIASCIFLIIGALNVSSQ